MKHFKKNIYRSAVESYGLCLDCVAHEVSINGIIWEGCNATVSTYRNGDTIPYVSDPTIWGSLTTGAWCWYNNDPANETTYGKLYNWYAVNDPRGFAPIGYHVATDAEWTELTTFLGGSLVAGGELKENTLCYWNAPNTGATNSVGFGAFGGGYRNDFASDFYYLKAQAYYWTSTSSGVGSAFNRFIYSSNGTINRFATSIREGYSVRLIKDTLSCPNIIIGTQTWTGCNATLTKYADGTDIPQITDPTEWASLTTGAWCYYNNDPTNASYGKLYNWYAIAGIYDSASLSNPLLRKQFAPSGYHVPTDMEWITLTNLLGGTSVAGGEMKEVGTVHWNSPNTGATNTSSFTALGSGSRNYDGTFSGLKSSTAYQCSNEYDTAQSWYVTLSTYNTSALTFAGDKNTGFSVRFIQD